MHHPTHPPSGTLDLVGTPSPAVPPPPLARTDDDKVPCGPVDGSAAPTIPLPPERTTTSHPPDHLASPSHVAGPNQPEPGQPGYTPWRNTPAPASPVRATQGNSSPWPPIPPGVDLASIPTIARISLPESAPRAPAPTPPPAITTLWSTLEGPVAWEIRRVAAQQGISPEVLAGNLLEGYLMPFPVPPSLEAGLRAAALSAGQPPQVLVDRALRAIQAPRLMPPLIPPVRSPRLGSLGGCLTPSWLLFVIFLLLAGAMACCWITYIAVALAAHVAYP